jgi:hypothetical protein
MEDAAPVFAMSETYTAILKSLDVSSLGKYFTEIPEHNCSHISTVYCECAVSALTIFCNFLTARGYSPLPSCLASDSHGVVPANSFTHRVTLSITHRLFVSPIHLPADSFRWGLPYHMHTHPYDDLLEHLLAYHHSLNLPSSNSLNRSLAHFVGTPGRAIVCHVRKSVIHAL